MDAKRSAILIGAMFLAGAAYGAPDLADGFREFDAGKWLLLGNAHHDPAAWSVVLTEAAGNQAGGLFHLEPISTENLEVTFTAQIGGGSGADGMALVIVGSDAPPDAVTPPCGSCMGFSGWAGTILHVELDTYGGADDFETNAETANHIGVGFTTVGGNAGSPVTQPSATVILPDDIRGAPIAVRVALEDGYVTVEIRNETWAPDPIAIIDGVEIENWEGDFEGYIGFCAATGGGTDRHEIQSVRWGGFVRPCARLERSFGVAKYVPGTPFDVTLSVSNLCADPDTCRAGAAETVTIVETLPAGWKASSPSDGGRVGPDNVVAWTFAGGSLAPRDLRYKAASGAETKCASFSGELTCSGFPWPEKVAGASRICGESAKACAIEDDFAELDDALWYPMGTAYHDAATESLVLTRALGNQAGCLFYLEPISTENLEITFTAQIGGGSGADGMAMVLIEGDTPPAALTPPCGSCMGFSGWSGTILHVELDTYGGGDDFETNAAAANHIGVGFTTTGGGGGSPRTQTSATAVLPNDIRGVPLTVRVLLEDGVVTVEIENETWAAGGLVVIDQVEIENWAGDFEGVLGFCAATGGGTDRHEVHDICIAGIDVRCPGKLGVRCAPGGGVELSWKNREILPASARVARDGRVIAAAAPAVPPTYLDANPGLGLHTYEVAFAMPDGPPECILGPVEVEVFPNVDVTPWTSVDLGTSACGGIEKVAGGFAIYAEGSGTWAGSSSDSLRFTYREFTGDFTLTARIDSLDATHPQAFAGLMARASLDRSAAGACVFATSPDVGSGIYMVWRETTGAAAGGEGPFGPMELPIDLRLSRIGPNFAASYSTDGATWIDGAAHAVALDPTVLVGIAATSGERGGIATAEVREIGLVELDICPSDVRAVCKDATVELTWKNNYPYARIRIYRIDAARTSRRIASIAGTLQTYSDAATATLPAGTLQYQIVPVVGTAEILSCQACPRPELGLGDGAKVCLQWPSCGASSCCAAAVRFIRADADGTGNLTIGDGIQILDRLFSGRTAFGSNCDKAGDFDDSGALEIGDAISIFNLLFVAGSRLPKPPYPGCGADPTEDSLPCVGPVPACP